MNIVKNGRKKMRMTEKELARKCDVHQTYIEKLENNKRTPSFKMIGKLSTVLRLCPIEIFKDTFNCCTGCQFKCPFNLKPIE